MVSTLPSDLTNNVMSTLPSDLTNNVVSTLPSDLTNNMVSTLPSDLTNNMVYQLSRKKSGTYEPQHEKTNKVACAPIEDTSAWAFAQSDQSFRCPHEESLGP